MKAFIVTEGPMYIVILKQVLEREIQQYSAGMFSAGSKSAVESLARTILAVRGEPVVVVVDSDSTKPNEVKEQRRLLENTIGEVGPEGMWKVCLAIPVIEEWFFEDPEAIKQLFQQELSHQEMEEARSRPKEIIEKLFRQQNIDYTAAGVEKLFQGKDVSLLRKSRLAQEIREALEAVTKVAG